MKTEKRYIVFASPLNGTAGGFYIPVMDNREAASCADERASRQADIQGSVVSPVERHPTFFRRLLASPLLRKVA